MKSEFAKFISNHRVSLDHTQRLWRAGAAFCIAAGLVILKFVNPEDGGLSLTTPLSQRLFGLPCPFCGITRGTHALLNGDIARALYLNMATTLALLVSLSLVLIWTVEAVRGREWIRIGQAVNAAFRRWKLWALALVLFWIVHLTLAVGTPKPELLDPDAWLFPF